jgi:hypothetical protein
MLTTPPESLTTIEVPVPVIANALSPKLPPPLSVMMFPLPEMPPVILSVPPGT